MVLLATVFDPIAWTGFEKSLGGLCYEMIVWGVLASGQLWRVRNFSSTQNGPRGTIYSPPLHSENRPVKIPSNVGCTGKLWDKGFLIHE